MFNRLRALASTARSPPRDSAGAGDATGVSVTGGDPAGATGADGVTGGATGATGVTGTATVAKKNWAAADTKATTGSGVDGTTGNAGATGTSGCMTGGNTGTGGAGATGKAEATGVTVATSKAEADDRGVKTPKGKKRDAVVHDPEKRGTDPDLDMCGLEPDPEGLWVDAVFEPRIKESRLTPEEKAKFRGHLDKIFHPDAIKGIRIVFRPDDIIEVVDKVIPYLKSEPMLIEDVPFDITIVADLHGQLYDLHRLFVGDEKDGKPGWENMKYLFLGDYVDRGRQSLEIVMALFCLKMLYPDRIFILRGNHEFVSTNVKNGFMFEFFDRYREGTWQHLFYKVNVGFCYLSCAAIVGNSYFCAHGGISPSAFTRRHLMAIMKPIYDSRQDVIIHDIVWSDIARGLRGTTFNGPRSASHYYGLDELALALYNMDCIAMFRGHTVLHKGFELIGNMCVGLFTASGAKNFNDGAVAVVDAEGAVSMRIFKCNPERVRLVSALKRRDTGQLVESDDEITQCDDDDSGDGATPVVNST